MSEDITLTSGITLELAPNCTLTWGVGKEITASGDDLHVFGHGDTSHMDFSAETGAVVPITMTGNRGRFNDFKLTGSRAVGGGTGTGIFYDTATQGSVERCYFINTGSAGVAIRNSSQIIVQDNRMELCEDSGVFCNTGCSEIHIENNRITECVKSGTSGQSGVAVRGNTASANDHSFWIRGNYIKDCEQVGIQVNGATNNTYNVFIENNVVLDNNTAGEGIAVALVDNFRIAGNRVDKAFASGIIVDPGLYGTVSGNIVSNSSQSGAATHHGIQIVNVAAGDTKHIVVEGNVCYDDQGTGTQVTGVQLQEDSGTLADILVYGNQCTGNTTNSVAFSPTAARQRVISFGNTVGTSASHEFEVYRMQGSEYSGGTLAGGSFALHANWGDAASVGTITGTGQRGRFTVTSSGSSQGANPTVTITFPDGAWPSAPHAVVGRAGGDQLTVADTWSTTTTTLVITFNGTPVAAQTYVYEFILMG
jgi:hypothetical protein